ncbi:YjfB family protein [Lachnospiraceae bacterium 62-35]
MDIAALSVSMSTSRFAADVSMALMSKALDTAEIAGEALTEMMEAASIVPGLGEHIDIRA